MKPHRENRGGAGETSDLLVIVPSRGRPQNAADFVEAWRETSRSENADLLFAVDDDDLTRPDYEVVLDEWAGPGHLMLFAEARLGMCGTLNLHAVKAANHYAAIGFAGDDHRFRTPDATATILDELHELGTGIVYGNDLIHGEGLPTAVFMTSDIVRALGYMAPPRQKHLYLDDAWLALGHALDAIRYLPDVVIEHVHPIAGKAEWDEGYVRVNSAEIQEHDRIEFERWRDHDLPGAVEKIRAACG